MVFLQWSTEASGSTEGMLRSSAVALTGKEAILFMQRLASIDRNGLTEGPIKGAWEKVFLEMVYTMCTTERPHAPEVFT